MKLVFIIMGIVLFLWLLSFADKETELDQQEREKLTPPGDDSQQDE